MCIFRLLSHSDILSSILLSGWLLLIDCATFSFRNGNFRDSHSLPLPEPVAARSLSRPPVKLERKMQGVFSLSPQGHAPSSLCQTPVLTSMGPGRKVLNIIWEPANQLPPSLTAQHDSIAPILQYLEQVGAKNRARFLLQELNACKLKRDVARPTKQTDSFPLGGPARATRGVANLS